MTALTELSCEAMAAEFRVQLVEPDTVYARQAGAAAREELQLLERLLSRYIDNSDVFRINRLSAGQETVVAVETFRCLQAALNAKRTTFGAFDVSYASEGVAGGNRIQLDPAGCTVRVLDRGVRIDLGGIGKGFALDRMAGVLRQWDIAAARLWASSSTVLAFGQPQPDQSWTVDFGPTVNRRQWTLRDSAFSGSGTEVKGQHVIDPRTGRATENRRRTWVAAPTATMADALSTAAMVMDYRAIRRCCRKDPRVTAFVATGNERPMMVFND